MKYKYIGECKGNDNNGCFMDSCGHDCGCFIRVIDTDISLSTYKELEDKEVYIHYIPEHYNDGSNLCFSIEFKGKDTQTAWYNDNHEFGGVYETMVSSVKLAQWYLENPRRIELLNSGYHEQEYRDYIEEHRNFLKTLYIQQ